MKRYFGKIFSWIIRHPWSVLFGVVAFVILLTFLPFGNNDQAGKDQAAVEKIDNQKEGDSQNNSSEADDFYQDGNMPTQDESSPFDDDPAKQEEAARDISSDPAVQFLPYRGALILADIVDRQGGKLVVHVQYMGDRSFAEREWREFLDSHNDDGSSYQVVYIEKK